MLSKFRVPVLAIGLWTLQFFILAFPAHAAGVPASWIKGGEFIPQSSTDFSSDRFKQSVQNFKALGGNYVNFVIPYYQSNPSATDIGPGWNTPTDDSLIAGIQYVHSLGLHAQLSVYLENYSGDWRAYINPGDRDTWYQKYGDVLVRYGTVAQQQGVELYMLGAELIDMSSGSVNPDNTTRWNGMIDRVRSVYSGPLTYGSDRAQDSWGDEADNIGFWNRLDYVGMSAYYGLFGDGSVASMEGDWQNLTDTLIQPLERFGKPILFTEIGYRSVAGAHNQPWDSGMQGPYDPDEQVRDYTALFDFWSKQNWMAGTELWWFNPDPNYGGSGNTDYTPQNKPAADTIKQWWQGGASTPPPQGPVSFTAQGSANPASPQPGQQTTLTANVTDTSGTTGSAIIDLELYQGNTQVLQQFLEGQSFTSGQTRQYSVNWTPGAAGQYTFKIGVFASGWSQLYLWQNDAADITVGSGSGTPPPQGTVTMDIWWPTDGVHLSGVQPLKAMLENLDASQYSMTWQVDGGGAVPMYDSSADWPHKEALVDFSGWTWNGSGPYKITFTATNGSGAVIAQKSITIFTP